MIKFLLLFLLAIHLSIASAVADDGIKYIYTSKRSPANAVVHYDGSFLVIGPQTYMLFNGNIAVFDGYAGPLDAKFSGPSSLKGYTNHIRKDKNGDLVVSGVNHDRSFSFDDQRQNFIALIQLKSFKIITEKNFSERVSLGIEVLEDGNFLALAQGSGRYFKLSTLNEKLQILNTVAFGGGTTILNGSLAITPEGNYAVLGFEGVGDNEVLPVYWEFSPELQQIDKMVLMQSSKKSGNDAVLEFIRNENSLYAAYGWDTGNTKDEAQNEVHLTKIKGTSVWKKDALMPYKAGMHFFATKTDPYVLYPRVDYLEKITFDSATGERAVKKLNRPTDPVECFPPKKKYDIVDVVQSEAGVNYISFSNTPLDK